VIPVLCAGMIRSGSTLQFQLAAAIVEAAGAGERLPWEPEVELERTLEVIRDEPGLRVVKAHICTPGLAAWAGGGAPVLYVHRDLREVAASLMRKLRIGIDELLARRWLDGAIAAYAAWTSMPNVLVRRYAELVEDPAAEAVRIHGFLASWLGDRRLAEPQLREIGLDHDLTRQRQRVANLVARHGRQPDPGELLFDPRELLHHDHFGAQEDRERASPEVRAELSGRFRDWLRAAGYPPDA